MEHVDYSRIFVFLILFYSISKVGANRHRVSRNNQKESICDSPAWGAAPVGSTTERPECWWLSATFVCRKGRKFRFDLLMSTNRQSGLWTEYFYKQPKETTTLKYQSRSMIILWWICPKQRVAAFTWFAHFLQPSTKFSPKRNLIVSRQSSRFLEINIYIHTR